MPGTQETTIHVPTPGGPHPQLALHAIQQPYSHLITAYYHYYRRPTYIRFKDTPPSDVKSPLPYIHLTPRLRRLMLAELNQPDLGHPRRLGVR